MEKRRLKPIFLLLALLTTSVSFGSSSNFLDDTFYRDGKYYVPVLILSIIFLAIVAYLVTLDRKISKLEKDLNDED
jgi:CcmD family protein